MLTHIERTRLCDLFGADTEAIAFGEVASSLTDGVEATSEPAPPDTDQIVATVARAFRNGLDDEALAFAALGASIGAAEPMPPAETENMTFASLAPSLWVTDEEEDGAPVQRKSAGPKLRLGQLLTRLAACQDAGDLGGIHAVEDQIRALLCAA